jgi:hypothetical protein
LSQKDSEVDASPAGKIEWLISEARKLKTPKSDEKKAEDIELPTEENRDEAQAQKRTMKEDILTTLTDTSRELSRVIGLLERQEIVPPEPQVPRRFCRLCGRYLVPNAFYCDRCGARVDSI